MKTYQLIKLSPLKLQYSSVNGLPSSLTRDAAAPPTPDGYDYVEDLPMPDDVLEGQYYVRDLTAESYGWKLETTVEPSVEEVTNIQMRDALIDKGLHDTVDDIIAAMPETTDQEIVDKKKMYDWWQHAATFRRDNARIATMQAALGLTDEEVDAIFLAASLVE
tara:strand:- start:3181 stop:3669 length:489 start_codon:yes stop_codon:yes gene_type:complete